MTASICDNPKSSFGTKGLGFLSTEPVRDVCWIGGVVGVPLRYADISESMDAIDPCRSWLFLGLAALVPKRDKGEETLPDIMFETGFRGLIEEATGVSDRDPEAEDSRAGSLSPTVEYKDGELERFIEMLEVAD
jgi:hypothetical protein